MPHQGNSPDCVRFFLVDCAVRVLFQPLRFAQFWCTLEFCSRPSPCTCCTNSRQHIIPLRLRSLIVRSKGSTRAPPM